MGALEGFYSTWNKARETFGVGTPTDGAQHDGSSQLLKMKDMVDSALPDERWQGKGAEAYAAANIVTTGHAQLDTTKSWVASMVDSIPKSLSAQDRENKLIPIANQGITQVSNTVSTANGDMLRIGFRVTEIKRGYDELQISSSGREVIAHHPGWWRQTMGPRCRRLRRQGTRWILPIHGPMIRGLAIGQGFRRHLRM